VLGQGVSFRRAQGPVHGTTRIVVCYDEVALASSRRRVMYPKSSVVLSRLELVVQRLEL